MDAVQIHTQAADGLITIKLSPEHSALANAKFLVLLVPEATETVESPSAQRHPGTDWDALQRAYEAFEGHDPYPTITDAVAWQREIRSEWDRDPTALQS